MIKKNDTLLLAMFLFITGIFCVPLISSCGKGAAASNIGINTQLEILNLSPDLHPVNLYIGYVKQSTTTYSYPYPSGYFYLSSIDTPIQIRSALYTTTNLLSISKSLLSNHKYSLFITGLNADSSITSIFTLDDTVSTPAVGYGKVRFINSSVASPALDIIVNGTYTTNFTNVKYKTVTPYVSLPAGNYVFQFTPTGVPGTKLTTTLSSTTIQDGRIYTLYSYGETSRTDTAAFGAAVLVNR